MKYAFMTFSCPEASLDEVLALATRFGYDGVEPRIGSNHGHGIELEADAIARHDARRQAEDAGVAICCIATSCRFADPQDAPRFLDELRRAIDLAGDVGSPRVRVFGGKLGEGVDRERATDLVAEGLRSVAPQALGRGVTVCMETHDEWTEPAHMAEVMRRVDHEAVAVNWDIMHPVRFSGRTMDEAFRALEPWIRHVHFHDAHEGENWALCPAGEGDIDHRRAVQLLLGAGYDGYLSGEWIKWTPAAEHLGREVRSMRSFESP